MQPYFLPYIGYFQLISAVDKFIIYDNIKYTKKGWINRNRMLLDGSDVTFSLPLMKDSDSLDVVERELAIDFNRTKLLNRFKGAYGRAPYFIQTFPLLETIIRHQDDNLFGFLLHSIKETCDSLSIGTEIKVSSEIPIDHELKGQEKVLALCQAVRATSYLNPIGGMDLYSKEAFGSRGVDLGFLRSRDFEYPQFDHAFVPWLSIIDILMFNPSGIVCEYLATNYELI